jgi:ribokinase
MQACCWRLPRLPQPGETLAATAFSTEAAGKGLSVAVGCHRLGAHVDVIMAIGSDMAGDQLLRQLETEALAAAHVHRMDGRSGHGAGLIDAGGENVIAVHPGANDCLGPVQIERAAPAFARADIVYGQLEAPVAAVQAAFALGRRHGARTVLNPSPWRELPSELIDDTDVLVVNSTEAGLLFGQPLPEDRSARIAQISRHLPLLYKRWRGELLVVTLGAQGCVAFTRDGAAVDAASFDVLVANAVGAGDAFSAGLCVALAKGLPMDEALRAANACGALATTRPGILAALPRTDDVERLLRSAA